jgi:hypothetical protein
MSDRQISKATAILIRARDYLSDINCWCPEYKGSFGERIVDGVKQKCAVVALVHELVEAGAIYGENYTKVDHDLFKATRGLLDEAAFEMVGVKNPVDVNRLGHAKVMEMYDRAITLSMGAV